MSHFLTLVFTKKNGKTVEELLAPFDRNIEYAPYVLYTKEQAIAKIRKDIEACANGWYAEYLADHKIYEKNCDNKAHLDYIKNEFPKRLNWTDDECRWRGRRTVHMCPSAKRCHRAVLIYRSRKAGLWCRKTWQCGSVSCCPYKGRAVTADSYLSSCTLWCVVRTHHT